MKKITWIVIAVLLVALLSVGCATTPTPSTAPSTAPSVAPSVAPSAAAKVIKIGWIGWNASNEFSTVIDAGMKAAVQQLGDKVQVNMLDAGGSNTTQISEMEQLIGQKVDVIVMNPCDAKALTSSVEAANAAGIPVVEPNKTTAGGKFTYVGSNDLNCGTMQGQWVADNMPQGTKYVIAMAPMGETPQIDRLKGFKDVVTVARPDLVELAEQTGNGQRDQGMALAEDWLQRFPDFTLFASQADSMALGAIQAIKDAGKLSQITVLGVDGTADGVKAVAAGEMKMTLFQNGYLQGWQSIMTAVAIVKGLPGATDNVVIPFEYVTKDNAAKYASPIPASPPPVPAGI